MLFFGMGGAIRDNAEEVKKKTSITDAIRHSRYFVIVEAIWKQTNDGDGIDSDTIGREQARLWVRKGLDILSKYRTGAMMHTPDAFVDTQKQIWHVLTSVPLKMYCRVCKGSKESMIQITSSDKMQTYSPSSN